MAESVWLAGATGTKLLLDALLRVLREPAPADTIKRSEGMREQVKPAERGYVLLDVPVSGRLLSRAATARPRCVLLAAGIVFAAAFVFGLPAKDILTGGSSQFQATSSQYARANALSRYASGQSAYYGVAVILQGSGNIAASAVVRRAVVRVGWLFVRQEGFQRLADLVTTGSRDFVSRDGHQTVLLAAFGSPGQSAAAVDRVRRLLGSRGVDGLHAVFGGPDVAFAELDRRTQADLEHANLVALVVLLLLAPFVFGGLVAALLPLLVGGLAVLLAFAGLRFLDQITGPEISVYALPAASGVGLGLGLDYSRLLLGRYREQTACGASAPQAVTTMLATAGRTVIFSSLTIAAAASGALLVFPLEFLGSLGIAVALTALSAGAVALLVLPAALILLGPRVDALAPACPPWLRVHTRHDHRTIATAAIRRLRGALGWERLARCVTHRPLLVAATATIVLLAAAVPVFGLRLIPPSAQLLPASAESQQVERILGADFSRDVAGVIYTIYRAHPTGPTVRELVARQARIAAGRAQQLPARYLGDHTWELGLLPAGSPYTLANQRLLQRLRADAHGTGGLISGVTAYSIDQRASIAARLPLAVLILFAVTVGAVFLLTGAVVIALKAFLMNLVTVAAGMGLLVAIFQDSLAKGGLEEANLIFLAALAFALATDYELFLISRVNEEHRHHGLENQQAVAAGLTRTGSTITSAALLFCVAVASFTTAQLTFIQQFGVGVALMVLIDATIVRALLVPSLMVLLGQANWWAPAPLQAAHSRIHRQRRATDECQIAERVAWDRARVPVGRR